MALNGNEINGALAQVEPAGGAGGADTQLTAAVQPVAVTDPSDVNWTVRHPFGAVEVMAQGDCEPEYVPIREAVVLFPL